MRGSARKACRGGVFRRHDGKHDWTTTDNPRAVDHVGRTAPLRGIQGVVPARIDIAIALRVVEPWLAEGKFGRSGPSCSKQDRPCTHTFPRM